METQTEQKPTKKWGCPDCLKVGVTKSFKTAGGLDFHQKSHIHILACKYNDLLKVKTEDVDESGLEQVLEILDSIKYLTDDLRNKIDEISITPLLH